MVVIMCSDSSKSFVLVKDIMSFVNSVLRIAATLIIYIFHCEMQYDAYSKHHLFFAFSFFLFISGYYSVYTNKMPIAWIADRLKRIYLPYWIVIVWVIIVNIFVDYKEIGIKELFFLIIGGNLFVEHKLYVIGWFISAIVVMYICVFVITYFRYVIVKVVILAFLAVLLLDYGMPLDFFVFFSIGYALHVVLIRSGLELRQVAMKDKFVKFYCAIAAPVRRIQDYSYEFFLVHGGVVLFFTKVLHTKYFVALYGGFFMTIIGAIVLKIISNRLVVFLNIGK